MMDTTQYERSAPGSDPDPGSPNHAPEKPTDEARAGVELGRMRWVLHISMAAVIVAFAAAWFFSR